MERDSLEYGILPQSTFKEMKNTGSAWVSSESSEASGKNVFLRQPEQAYVVWFCTIILLFRSTQCLTIGGDHYKMT